MKTPHCCAIILNWNGRRFLDACLSSLRKQSLQTAVLLVDNGSQDGSVEYVKHSFPEVMVLPLEDNLGFCRANNLGMQEALEQGFESILLLNNDTTLAPDCVEQLHRVLHSDAAIAAVCPKIYFASEPKRFWYAGADFSLWTSRSRYTGWKEEDVGQYDRVRSISQATGCAVLVRSSAIKKVGALNPQYWAYTEDVEWSIRFRREGFWLMYAPAAHVWHKDGGSAVVDGSQDCRQYFTTRNLLLLCREHVRWFQVPVFLLGFLIFHVLYYGALRVVQGDRRAFFAMFRGMADSLQYHVEHGSVGSSARPAA
jgi:GT2 family glycosyltransferase